MAGNFRGQTFNALMQPRAVYDRPLTFRGTIAPLGTYQNPDGTEDVGFAWPGIITEPLKALQRLHENSYTEDGRLGMPNPEYQGNKDDALTALLSIYGGNALNPMKGGAARTVNRAATHDLPPFDMSEGRGSQTINGSHVRYGVDDRGVYVYDLETPQAEAGRGQARALMEGLTRSADEAGLPITLDAQPWGAGTNTAQLRKFYKSLGFESVDADGMMRRDALLSNSDKPLRGYRGVAVPDHLIPDREFQPARSSGAFWGTSSPKIADSYASLDGKMDAQTAPSIAPVDFNFSNPLVIDAGGMPWASVPFEDRSASTDALARVARMRGHDGLVVRNVMDDSGHFLGNAEPSDTIAALKPGTVRSATTGETLFSDTGKPSLMGSAVSSTIHDDSNSGAVNDPAWLEDFLRRYY